MLGAAHAMANPLTCKRSGSQAVGLTLPLFFLQSERPEGGNGLCSIGP